MRALTARGGEVRCLARRPADLRPRVPPGATVVAGDCLDRSSLDASVEGIEIAHYLLHSIGASGDFTERDRTAARNFADAARRAGTKLLVYLGGLGSITDDAELSSHLWSRHETGEHLRSAGIPVVEFRASVILGSGSLSFELIPALVDRLPVMICPRWVATLAQPIAVEDVVAYLMAALDLPSERGSHTFEIGGADVVSYGDIMREYARQRGLRRLFISVPMLTPHLSSLWLGLVTPVHARVGHISSRACATRRSSSTTPRSVPSRRSVPSGCGRDSARDGYAVTATCSIAVRSATAPSRSAIARASSSHACA